MNKDEANSKKLGEAMMDVVDVPSRNQDADHIDDNSRIAELEAQVQELTNDLQRTRADFENFRRQSEQQKEQFAKAIELKTVKKVLPLIDDFERATAAEPKIMKPLAKSFNKTMNTLGVERIDTTVGANFDPELHFATSVEGDGDAETIASTLQSGYYYQGEVLRPAFVKVAKQ